MDAKTAAKNSIYIITFSQISSITLSILSGTVPNFTWLSLAFMVCGGIGGVLIGSAISRRMDFAWVEKLLKILQ